MTCRVPECNRQGSGRHGLCPTHARYLRKGQYLSSMRALRPRRAKRAPCSQPGCNAQSHARGLCSFHYKRWQSGCALDRPYYGRGERKPTSSSFVRAPETQKQIAAIVHLRRQGWTCKRIAQALNGAGYRTTRGSPFNGKNISNRILRAKSEELAHD